MLRFRSGQAWIGSQAIRYRLETQDLEALLALWTASAHHRQITYTKVLAFFLISDLCILLFAG